MHFPAPVALMATMAVLPFSASFAPNPILSRRVTQSSSLGTATQSQQDDTMDTAETILIEQGIVAQKLTLRPSLPEERGKGGVNAKEDIAALEVIARIPRSLIIATCDSPLRAVEAAAAAKDFSWAADLCAISLITLFPNADDPDNKNNEKMNEEVIAAKQNWVSSWKDGGWATDGADLGPPEVDWGPKCVTGSLLATGSDLDKEVYAKFRFPCHPVVHRAALGLALLTGAEDQDALDALLRRGSSFRGMRDALLPLVRDPSERKGSIRERKSWDVADILSRVLARATTLQVVTDDAEEVAFAVVPLHERLAHCDARGENAKLVASGDEVLLVATRDITAGEDINRDYTKAPRLDGDTSDGSLHLLLQFGLPPSAWEN